MGSTSTGRFTDYPTTRRPSGEPPSGSEGNGGQDDRCGKAISDQLLDDVERCDYWTSHHDVPPVGSDVELLPNLHEGRLAVALAGTGEILGYLPTKFNYLRGCMEEGWRYQGEVVATLRELTALIRVDLGPQ